MSRKANAFKGDIVFRTIEWGFDKFSFTAEELFLEFEFNWEERGNIKSLEGKWLWENAFTANQQDGGTTFVGRETIFKCLTPSSQIGKGTVFCLTTEAKFKYIDFLELEQARKNSEQAQKNALSAQRHAGKSIRIAWAALVISAIGSIATVITIFIDK